MAQSRSSSWIGAVVGHATYPVLLVATVCTAVAACRLGLDPGGTSFLFLIGTIAFLSLMERLCPYQRHWLPGRREWGHFGVYFLLTMVGGGLAQACVVATSSAMAAPVARMPLWAEVPLALLAGSLASYLFHRASHRHAWLWRLHGVHHVPETVSVSNNVVNHVLDVLIAQFLTQSTLAVLGFSQPAVLVVGLLVIAQGQFIHANIDVRLGWLNYVVTSPEQHRMHHSTELSEAGHFGDTLAVWDWVFGSYTWRPGRAPARVGLKEPASFPPTGAVLSTLLHPWRVR